MIRYAPESGEQELGKVGVAGSDAKASHSALTSIGHAASKCRIRDQGLRPMLASFCLCRGGWVEWGGVEKDEGLAWA